MGKTSKNTANILVNRMCCRVGTGQCTAAAFMVLCLGLAVWGVATTGMLAFWVGWSMAALFVGYVLAFRMEFLDKITNTIGKTPGLTPSLQAVSLGLFADVYLLFTYHSSLWDLLGRLNPGELSIMRQALWLIPFLAAFSLYHLVILPQAVSITSWVRERLGDAEPQCCGEVIRLTVLEVFMHKTDNTWAQKIYADAVAFRDKAKQVTSLSVSVLLLLVTDFWLGQTTGTPGMGQQVFTWFGGLPLVAMLVVGGAVLKVLAFTFFMTFFRNGAVDEWVVLPLGFNMRDGEKKGSD